MIKSVSAIAFACAVSFAAAAMAEEAEVEPAAAPAANEPEAPPAPAAPAAEQPPVPKPEKDPMDEVVCRREETTVGSRLGARKVCKTRRQWRDEARGESSDTQADGAGDKPS